MLADMTHQAPGTRASTPYEDIDRAHHKLRAPGERANAQLKAWRIIVPGAQRMTR